MPVLILFWLNQAYARPGVWGHEESLIGTAASCENQEVTLCVRGGGGDGWLSSWQWGQGGQRGLDGVGGGCPPSPLLPSLTSWPLGAELS